MITFILKSLKKLLLMRDQPEKPNNWDHILRYMFTKKSDIESLVFDNLVVQNTDQLSHKFTLQFKQREFETKIQHDTFDNDAKQQIKMATFAILTLIIIFNSFSCLGIEKEFPSNPKTFLFHKEMIDDILTYYLFKVGIPMIFCLFFFLTKDEIEIKTIWKIIFGVIILNLTLRILPVTSESQFVNISLLIPVFIDLCLQINHLLAIILFTINLIFSLVGLFIPSFESIGEEKFVFCNTALILMMNVFYLFNNRQIVHKNRDFYLLISQLKRIIEIKKQELNKILPSFLGEQRYDVDKMKVNKNYSEPVVIIFCDVDKIKYEQMNEKEDIIDLLNGLYHQLSNDCIKAGVIKIENVAKTFMAASGISDINDQSFLNLSDEDRKKKNIEKAFYACELFLTTGHKMNIPLKIGMTYGPVMDGILSIDKPQYLLIGHPVNFASRISNVVGQYRFGVSEDLINYIYLFKNKTDHQVIKVQLKGIGEKEIHQYKLSDEPNVNGFIQHAEQDISSSITEPIISDDRFRDLNNNNDSSGIDINDRNNNDEEFGIDHSDKIVYDDNFKGRWFLFFKNKGNILPKLNENLAKYSQYNPKKPNNLRPIGKLFLLILIHIIGIRLSYDSNYIIWMAIILLIRVILAFLLVKGGKYENYYVAIITLSHFIHFLIVILGGFPFRVLQIEIFFSLISENEIFNKLREEKEFIYIIKLNIVYLGIYLLTIICFAVQIQNQENLWILVVELIAAVIGFKLLDLFNLKNNKKMNHKFWNKRIKHKSKKVSLDIMTKSRRPDHMKNSTDSKETLRGVTFLFSDLKNFTNFVNNQKESPTVIYDVLSDLYIKFDKISMNLELFKLYTIGDSFIIMGKNDGLKYGEMRNSLENSEVQFDKEKARKSAIEVLKASCEMIKSLKSLKMDPRFKDKVKDIDIRIGIHTVGINNEEGDCWGGMLGNGIVERYDVFGKGFLYGQELEQNCVPGFATISAETYKLIKGHPETKKLERDYKIRFDKVLHNKNAVINPRMSNIYQIVTN